MEMYFNINISLHFAEKIRQSVDNLCKYVQTQHCQRSVFVITHKQVNILSYFWAIHAGIVL